MIWCVFFTNSEKIYIFKIFLDNKNKINFLKIEGFSILKVSYIISTSFVESCGENWSDIENVATALGLNIEYDH